MSNKRLQQIVAMKAFEITFLFLIAVGAYGMGMDPNTITVIEKNWPAPFAIHALINGAAFVFSFTIFTLYFPLSAIAMYMMARSKFLLPVLPWLNAIVAAAFTAFWSGFPLSGLWNDGRFIVCWLVFIGAAFASAIISKPRDFPSV